MRWLHPELSYMDQMREQYFLKNLTSDPMSAASKIRYPCQFTGPLFPLPD